VSLIILSSGPLRIGTVQTNSHRGSGRLVQGAAETKMLLKVLAILGAIVCCIGGIYFIVLAFDFIANALHDPIGPTRSEYLEGACIAWSFSLACWAVLAAIARSFRQSLSSRAIRVAEAPMVFASILFGVSLLFCFAYAAVLALRSGGA